jgi:hypothetical protein
MSKGYHSREGLWQPRTPAGDVESLAVPCRPGGTVLAGMALSILLVPVLIVYIYTPLTNTFPTVAPILGIVLNYTLSNSSDLAYVGLLLPVLAYAVVVDEERTSAHAADASASEPASGLAMVHLPFRLARWLVVLSIGVFYVYALAGVLGLVALILTLGVG